ncbi:hypothetical protein, partial [Salmonella enterica]|uniref:hypothetical protein n=1 Tax=Salmonella enterica TaxID=28901 RepID=UPI0020C2BF19
FMEEAMRVAKQLHPLLQEIPEEQVRNRLITEWVKREACWDRVQESDIKLSVGFLSTLVPETRVVRHREVWPSKATLLWQSGAWR